jgi:hypothetical protein
MVKAGNACIEIFQYSSPPPKSAEPMRAVSHCGLLDHTSMLKLLVEKYGKPGEQYSDDVAARTSIQSVNAVLSRDTARPGPPPVPTVTLAATTPPATLPLGAMLSPNQLAFRNALEEIRQSDPKAGAQKFSQLKNYFLRGSR